MATEREAGQLVTLQHPEPKIFSDAERDEFADWLEIGIKKGWVSDPVCVTHEGLPLTKVEEDEWEDGYDPCSPGLRIWVE